ncbi:MAG: DUF393 domain-containing protein [Candidatus Omnitrophica bacterium]|nr:DUF393 domain-containing protein [Candidatus Omnitrophota bacterium]
MDPEIKPNRQAPVMLYDGDCAFCQHWIEKWGKVTRGYVEYVPYQKGFSQYPQVTEKECREAVQMIMPDGAHFSGAHAVLKSLALSGRYRAFLWCYEQCPISAWLSERLYRAVAHNRPMLSRVTREKKCKLD